MLPKKEAKKLLKEMAFAAAKRWKDRADIRRAPGIVKGENDEEIRKSNERVENSFTRNANRPRVNPDMLKPIRFPERIIKGNDLREFPPNEIARKAGKPVARIETIPAAGQLAEGFATGFLISPNLLMTNFHVFPDARDAQDCAANFLYERTMTGINSGFQFRIDPTKFFLSDAALDFAIVFVEPVSLDNKFSLATFSFLNLIATSGKILNGQSLNIIQHPQGGVKQYAFLNNRIVDILENDGFIHYTTDTDRGSSGSPGYNDTWEVAALHHSGVPLIIGGNIVDIQGNRWDEENQGDDEIQWIANEGISISRIIEKLITIQFPEKEKQSLLDTFIQTTKDPLLNRASVIEKTAVINNGIQKNILSNKNDPDMSAFNLNFYGNTNVFVGETTGRDASIIPATQKASIVQQNGTKFIEKKQNFDTDYDNRPGFDKDFINGFSLEVPTVISQRADELFLDFNNSKPYVLNYHHYSLVMNKKRRLMMWSASNVDYNADKRSTKDRAAFGSEDWTVDPRIPAKFQITDSEFYKPATKVDRGHIIRRDDNCWGDSELEIEYANADSYHWTNCTPQHELFNRDVAGYKGLWGMVENEIVTQLKLVDKRATLFAGPILDNENDPVATFNEVQIQYPLKFWKIVVANDADEGPVSYGFILDQSNVVNKFGLETLDFSRFKKYQVTIQKITELTGVVFDRKLYDTDILRNTEAFESGLRPFRNSNEILLRKQRVLEDKY